MGVGARINIGRSSFDPSRGTSIPLPSILISTPLPSSTSIPVITMLILIVVAIVSIVVVVVVGMCRPTRASTITATIRPIPGAGASIRSSSK